MSAFADPKLLITWQGAEMAADDPKRPLAACKKRNPAKAGFLSWQFSNNVPVNSTDVGGELFVGLAREMRQYVIDVVIAWSVADRTKTDQNG